MRWLVFVLFLMLQLTVSLPYFVSSCVARESPAAIAVWFSHHMTDVFLFWGALMTTTRLEYGIHLAFIAIVIAHWMTNKNRCALTVLLNRWCGWPEDQWLDSLLNRAGLRQRVHEYWQFAWLGVIVIYNSWRILK